MHLFYSKFLPFQNQIIRVCKKAKKLGEFSQNNREKFKSVIEEEVAKQWKMKNKKKKEKGKK